MDIVFIEALQVDAIIGIYDWERERRQPLSIDLELASDIRAAASTDNIADALDYEAICTRLTHFIETSHFELVETLAEACANLLMEEFGVTWLRLKLRKPEAIANTRSVGVLIERGEHSQSQKLKQTETPDS